MLLKKKCITGGTQGLGKNKPNPTDIRGGKKTFLFSLSNAEGIDPPCTLSRDVFSSNRSGKIFNELLPKFHKNSL